MKWLWRLMFTTMLAAVLAISLLFSALYQTYYHLGQEVPVAQVSITPLGKQLYELTLQVPGQCQPMQFPVRGDDWRLDARFIKWPNWLTVLGLTPQYRLERLAGRYQDIQQANHAPRTVYALAPQTWLKPAWLDSLSWLIDSDYGSSVYAPLRQGQYRVYHSASGLFLRPAPPSANAAAVTPDCTKPVSYWQQAAHWLDQQLRS